MSVWWVAGIAAVLLAESALAWRCWRRHRHGTRSNVIYCLGLNPIRRRTGYCRYRRCSACNYSRAVGAELREAHPEIFHRRERR